MGNISLSLWWSIRPSRSIFLNLVSNNCLMATPNQLAHRSRGQSSLAGKIHNEATWRAIRHVLHRKNHFLTALVPFQCHLILCHLHIRSFIPYCNILGPGEMRGHSNSSIRRTTASHETQYTTFPPSWRGIYPIPNTKNKSTCAIVPTLTILGVVIKKSVIHKSSSSI